MLQVDQWLDQAAAIAPGLTFEPTCKSIDAFLALRTFLVGYSPTAADVAVWGALQGGCAPAPTRRAAPPATRRAPQRTTNTRRAPVEPRRPWPCPPWSQRNRFFIPCLHPPP